MADHVDLLIEHLTKSGDFDFCIWRNCKARCDHDELPVGWAVFSLNRNDDGKSFEVHGALCPKHINELLRQFQNLKHTGSFSVRLRE